MSKRAVSDAAAPGRWVRCLAAMTIRVSGRDQVEYLWPGLIVNLDRTLAPGFTVGDAISGRPDCVEASGAPGVEIADDPAAPRLDASTGLGDASTWVEMDGGPLSAETKE